MESELQMGSELKQLKNLSTSQSSVAYQPKHVLYLYLNLYITCQAIRKTANCY